MQNTLVHKFLLHISRAILLTPLLFINIPHASAGVQITGLEDFNFGLVSVTMNTLKMRKHICIYDKDNSLYQIRFTDNNSHNANFYMRCASGHLIRYQVKWKHRRGQIKPGMTYGLQGASQSLECAGIPSSQQGVLTIMIHLRSSDTLPSPGHYTDELTLFIEPV